MHFDSFDKAQGKFAQCKQKGFAGIIVLIVVLILAGLGGAYYYFQKSPKYSMGFISTPPEIIKQIQTSTPSSTFDETANWKTYTNEPAKFSIEYPSSMTYTEESLGTKLKQSVFKGDEGTISIEYALAGEKTAWGGGCDQVDHKIIAFLNKQTEVCLGNDYLGQLFVSHPEKIADFQISAQFSPMNKEKILKILSTFKFLDQKDVRISLKPADSQAPVAGVCLGPLNDADIILNLDMPSPRCLKVSSAQRLKVINKTDQSVTLTLGQVRLNILPGQQQIDNQDFGSYLAPGVHFVKTTLYGGGGPEIWLQ